MSALRIDAEGKTLEEIRDEILDLRSQGFADGELSIRPGRLREGFWTNTKPDRYVETLTPGTRLFGVAVVHP